MCDAGGQSPDAFHALGAQKLHLKIFFVRDVAANADKNR